MMNNSVKKELKEYLVKRKFDKYNEILIQEITQIFVKKIRKYESKFVYTNQLELLETVETFLNNYEINVCREFYNSQKSNYEPEFLAEILMEIYKVLNED